MNTRNDIDSARPDASPVPAATVTAARRSTPRWSRRRGVASIFASVAVAGLAAAIVAPAGIALADPPQEEAPDSLYAVALSDTQNITVSGEGAEIAATTRGSFEVYVTPKPTPTPTPEPAAKSSGSESGGSRPAAPSPLYYTGGGAPAEWMAAAGIAESDWGYVDYIVSRESGWNPNATNKSSGACGLVQALPCSKVPGNGYDPVDNLRWATGYAVGRYGSWAGAHSFWVNNHWW